MSLILFLSVCFMRHCVPDKQSLGPIAECVIIFFPHFLTSPIMFDTTVARTRMLGRHVLALNHFDVIHQTAPVGFQHSAGRRTMSLGQKDFMSSFSASQLALNQIGTFLCDSLLTWALRHMSTRINQPMPPALSSQQLQWGDMGLYLCQLVLPWPFKSHLKIRNYHRVVCVRL